MKKVPCETIVQHYVFLYVFDIVFSFIVHVQKE